MLFIETPTRVTYVSSKSKRTPVRALVTAWVLVFTALLFGVSGCAQNAPQNIRVSEHMQQLAKPLPYLAQVFGYNIEVFEYGPLRYPQNSPTAGSAFVWRDEKGRCGGYTSNHLLGAAEKTAWVRMDGKETAVEVPILSRDSSFDMVVLACPEFLGAKSASAKLGSAEDIYVGRAVFSVGFPQGVRSVAAGYVNSTSIAVTRIKSGPYLFSHQSPIQPGASGGPLFGFNDKDEPIVVGLNTAMSLEGLRSYATSPRYLRRIMARLWEKSPGVVNATFGATLMNLPGLHPQRYIGDSESGEKLRAYPPHSFVASAVVLGVLQGSPAGAGGLLEMDVIVAARHPDGTAILFATSEELLCEIFFHAPGETISFSVIRDGEPVNVAVTLGAEGEEAE